ncbi:unnamed protein product [Symbiodinium sp. KB8]|nr:unnamed protein product [Symbiodinium sp. KB8]
MWEVIQIGFQQVEDILDSINLGHYRDYFIAKGMFYGAKMRALSRKFLDLHMPAITDPDEKDREGWAHIENAYMEFSRHSLPRSQRGLRP